MKNILLYLIIFSGNFLFAHDVNYSHLLMRHWVIAKENNTVYGSFYMLKNDEVYIEDPNLSILHFPISSLSLDDQIYARKRSKWIQEINDSQKLTQTAQLEVFAFSDYKFWSFLFLLTLMFVYTVTIKEKENIRYFISCLTLGVIVFLFGFTYKTMVPGTPNTDPLFIDSAFSPFKPNVYTRWDSKYFYVESHGIPTTHPMMAGITNWQQQVPIPQCYTGNNPWSIPLNPEIAATPVPVNPQHFLRGAIAVAVNGIAIFNPYTNTGVDALLDGQLDNWGGHCGRADDYHYHVAPLHLYGFTSNTLPIAFALDGFAIYGSYEPDGSPMKPLDSNHGHYGVNGVYHYHGTATAPYMVGNMVGKVTEDSTLQIIPQAAAKPIRPAGTPLKGASITECKPNATNNGYTLNYTLNNQKYSIDYYWTPAGKYTFNFITPSGMTTSMYNGFVPCSIPTSFEEPILDANEIFLYPNPTFNSLFLEIGNEIKEKEITGMQIFDLKGNLIFKAYNYKHQIEFGNITNGTYLLKIFFRGHEITKKFIIQNL